MKLNIKKIENSEITIAETIRNTTYNNALNLGEKDFAELKKGVLALDEDKGNKVIELVKDIEAETGNGDKNQKMEDLKDFLLECGIAINQNIAASILFEGIKYMLM